MNVKNVTFIRFRPETYQNDIAIVETAMKMELNNITSKAINLPPLLYDPLKDSSVMVSGWGSLTANYSEEMMAANFTVVDRDNCEKQFKKVHQEDLITDGIFCAGGEGIHLDPGDEDDPAVQKNSSGILVLAGVATFLPKHPRGYPDIFTRVGYFVKSIWDIIGRN